MVFECPQHYWKGIYLCICVRIKWTEYGISIFVFIFLLLLLFDFFLFIQFNFWVWIRIFSIVLTWPFSHFLSKDLKKINILVLSKRLRGGWDFFANTQNHDGWFFVSILCLKKFFYRAVFYSKLKKIIYFYVILVTDWLLLFIFNFFAQILYKSAHCGKVQPRCTKNSQWANA